MATLSITAPPQPEISTFTLMAQAVEKGLDIEKLRALMDLDERYQATRAKSAFVNAMQRAQQAMKRIVADADNNQTHSKYATYSKIDDAIRPIYTAEGFSLSFDTAPTENPLEVTVLCEVDHIDGFTKQYRVVMPCDGKGPRGNDVMTRTHATGSALTYGRRYLVNMIFNLSIGQKDDDGNGASQKTTPRQAMQAQTTKPVEGAEDAEQPKGMNLAAIKDSVRDIEEAEDLDSLSRCYKDAYKVAYGMKDNDAMTMFLAAKDGRKKTLEAAQKEGK